MTAIFDMDGTLIDSSDIIANSINYVRNYLNLPPLDKSFIIKEINNPNANLAKIFYQKEKIETILYKKFREYYDKNYQKELILFEGVKELLINLKKNNIKLAIATNAYKKTALATLNHIGIRDIFDIVVSFEDVNEGKPKPDMLYFIINSLNSIKPIFIGDSQNDFLAAKSAKLPFLYVDFINKENGIKDIKELENNLQRFFQYN